MGYDDTGNGAVTRALAAVHGDRRPGASTTGDEPTSPGAAAIAAVDRLATTANVGRALMAQVRREHETTARECAHLARECARYDDDEPMGLYYVGALLRENARRAMLAELIAVFGGALK